MSALAAIIEREIAAQGPMRLDRYMALALGHPQHGYYPTRDPLGAGGDFTTAPEISQMFGELLGLWLAQAWMDAGAPANFVLAEAGPGRGSLMADILRATAQVPGFTPQVWLVETSPALRAVQKARLGAVSWADDISALPDLPVFFVANEFFDALPIRQFQRSADGWQEVLVGAGLKPALGAPFTDTALDARFGVAPATVGETCAPAESFAAALGARIAAQGGAALVVDYGDWRGTGDTLQALRAHAPANPFETPGQADITAHVQFAPLAAAAGLGGAFTMQGKFLERLGITARAQALADAGGQGVAAAHRRLTHPAEMGNLFKVLALGPAEQPMAGFDENEHFSPAI
ncbi:MAG: SAM-dependent methyltransferase [Paracoccaceae bacterium]